MNRRLLLALPMAALGLLVFTAAAWAEYRGSSIWENISPDSKLGGGSFADRYQLGAYRLDYKVDTGLNTSGYVASMAQWVAALLWTFTTWALRLAMDVFAWSYSLDLLNGDGGVFAPISSAVRSMQDTVFGQFTLAAVALFGLWMTWKTVAQRDYAAAAARVMLLLVLGGVAWAIIYQPRDTVGWASQQVNAVSLSFLGGMNAGDAEQAKRDVGDSLFRAFIYEPWKVLEFGGTHCVSRTRIDDEGFPVPVSPHADEPKICRDAEPYARAYLRAPGKKERDQVYFAIKNGEAPWDKADAPAVDPQQEGGAFDRLGAAFFVFVGSLGVVILLLWLSFAVVLAQVLAMFWVCLAPAALLAVWVPGGERLSRWWAGRLGTALLMKITLSLILSIVVTVGVALARASSSLGFMFSFGLACGFWWAVLLLRKRAVAALGFHEVSGVGQAVHRPVRTAAAAMGGEYVVRRISRREEDEEASTVREHSTTTSTSTTHEHDEHQDTTRPRPDSSSPPASAGREYSPPGEPVRDGTYENGRPVEAGYARAVSEPQDETTKRVALRPDPEPAADADRDASSSPVPPVQQPEPEPEPVSAPEPERE